MDKLIYNLKITIRNLLAHRKFTIINVIGLSVSLTVSLLIFVYVHYETTFDNFNPNSNQIYRILSKNTQDGTISAGTPLALSDVLKSDFPEFDKVVSLMRTYKAIEVDNNKFNEARGAIVEKEFFDYFNFPIKTGNPKTIFNDPFEAVITKSFANKIFGTHDAMGKTFRYEEKTFTVAGIIDDFPTNSIFKFDYLLSHLYRYKSYPDLNERWYEFGLHTFVSFKGNDLPLGFEEKLSTIEDKYYPSFMKDRYTYHVTKFKGSHLNSSINNDLVPSIAPIYLWILAVVAVIILIIACLNFMNISISIIKKRIVEIGIKKVNGATKGGLIQDFFVETSMVVIFSLIISITAVFLLLPMFNNLIGRDIILNISDLHLWVGAISFGIVAILISGIYPSYLVIKPKTVQLMLRKKISEQNNTSFQKSFVVIQFAIAIVLLVGQFFIFKQISFMQNHKLGFNKENLITIPVRSLGSRHERLKNANIFVETIDKYQSEFKYSKAFLTEFIPGFGFNNKFNVFAENLTAENGLELLSCDIDENFVDVLGLEILHGRPFSSKFSTEENAVLINESAFNKLGWKTIEGKSIGLFSKENRRHVVGVVNDINIKSLKHAIEPMFYQYGRHHGYPRYVGIKLNNEKKTESIAFLKKQWENLFPEIPFEFESVEEKYASSYGEEEKQSRITVMFSMIALFLSFLGLFALSTLESEKRTKEIGIRKVNGAKISEILTMLNKDFVKWVVIAFIIACPIAYYAMNKWLENFAYKTELSWWIFVLAGLMALVVALLTVSWQSWRAATRNPVEALRYE